MTIHVLTYYASLSLTRRNLEAVLTIDSVLLSLVMSSSSKTRLNSRDFWLKNRIMHRAQLQYFNGMIGLATEQCPHFDCAQSRDIRQSGL